jgi:mannose-6-phosphate isomerase
VAIASIAPRRVEKPWGRRDLPAPFGDGDSGRPIGEIVFDGLAGADSQLLVKFLFTSQKLSIQVHPDDLAARADGYKRGKDEAWIVIAAEPEATIGLGLTRSLSREELRAAALSGEIEQLIEWRPVTTGDCYYSPAGTIHAIGPGLSLLEIQQNLDLTYRLYDYGRPRELHLDQAVAAAHAAPALGRTKPVELAPGRRLVAGGKAFQVERLDGTMSGRLLPPGGELWVVALNGSSRLAGEALDLGNVRLADSVCELDLGEDAAVIIAYPGSQPAAVWKPEPKGEE